MKINSRHYILLLWAIGCIALVSYSYYFIYTKTITLAEHAINANNELTAEDTKKQHEQDLVKIYDTSKASRARISEILVEKEKVVNFIEMVERVGEDSRTKLEISSLSNEETLVKAKIETKGSWSGVMSALILLENLPLATTLSNVKMNASDILDKDPRTWTLSLDIEALLVTSK